MTAPRFAFLQEPPLARAPGWHLLLAAINAKLQSSSRDDPGRPSNSEPSFHVKTSTSKPKVTVSSEKKKNSVTNSVVLS